MFAASDCALVEHDPATNQLRVLGHSSFDEARGAANGHCELVLRSTVVRTVSG
jgi:hypothetical protein